MAAYWYVVEVNHERVYDGNVAADAMAAWTEAILSDAEYINIESLREVDEKLRK